MQTTLYDAIAAGEVVPPNVADRWKAWRAEHGNRGIVVVSVADGQLLGWGITQNQALQAAGLTAGARVCLNLWFDTPIVTKLDFMHPDEWSKRYDEFKKDCDVCHNPLSAPDILGAPNPFPNADGKLRKTMRCYACGKHLIDNT
jgi:hypothetical protein